MESALHFRTGLENDLRRAIENGEFSLHYQPQRDQAGRLIGVEALARWHNPFRGPVSPGLFIPVAEASGLILPLGHWVFEQACRQSVRWNRSDNGNRPPVVIAVNVSALQLRQPDFVQDILRTIEETGAQAAHLKLELTESAMVEDVQATIDKMLELKRHGLTLALDDFGTGYSNFAYLQQVPASVVKIDQSLIRHLDSSARDRRIVQSLIALAKELDYHIVAEGVETAQTLELLRAWGVDEAQGYYMARPLTPEAFSAHVRAAA